MGFTADDIDVRRAELEPNCNVNIGKGVLA
jgi:hypothetical protein